MPVPSVTEMPVMEAMLFIATTVTSTRPSSQPSPVTAPIEPSRCSVVISVLSMPAAPAPRP